MAGNAREMRRGVDGINGVGFGGETLKRMDEQVSLRVHGENCVGRYAERGRNSELLASFSHSVRSSSLTCSGTCTLTTTYRSPCSPDFPVGKPWPRMRNSRPELLLAGMRSFTLPV